MQQVESESLVPVGCDDRTIGHEDATEDSDIPDRAVVEVPPESFWLSKDVEFDWFDRKIGNEDATEYPDISVPVGCDEIGHEDATEDSDIPDSAVVEVPRDLPPESFWLSKDAEFDWFDRNAFLERKESTKRNFNSMNLNQIVNPSHSNSSSQRYSVNLKSKTAIIGLPKTQKTTYVDSKRRQCKPLNVRMFPMRSYSVGKAPTTIPVMEPSSPKVSCIGRVRSKKCRSRRKSSGQANEPGKSASQRSGTIRTRKSGLLSRITSFFRTEGHRRRKNSKSSSEKIKAPSENSVPRKICVSVKPVSSEPGTPSGPAALGDIIRFASGRRPESWGGSDDYDVVGCHSLDSGLRRV